MSRELMQKALDALDAGIAIRPGSWIHDEMGKALAAPQPAQEPTKAMIDAAERIDWSDSDVRGNIVNMWQAMCAVAPQPQRQPLTDAEIDAITVECFGPNADLEFHRHHARAIEAAHGIKEQS